MAATVISPMVGKINCGLANAAKCNGFAFDDIIYVQPVTDSIFHTDAEGYKQIADSIVRTVRKMD